jgi:DNA-binding transcriptional MerR regulator/quercetin dioxygenase-like cupin family protein
LTDAWILQVVLGGRLSLHQTACAQSKPCYNRARLENPPYTVKGKIEINQIDPANEDAVLGSHHTDPKPYLKIGDVARIVGVSSSVIRSWESLGLARPRRSESKYRLYSSADVKLLKRARYLRRVRGLNASAIVELLKREGAVRHTQNGNSGAIGAHLRQLRSKRGLSLAQVAQPVGISVGFLSALERSLMTASVGTLRKLARFYKTSILDFFDAAESDTPLVSPAKRKVLQAGNGVRLELLAWGNKVMEPHLFRIAPNAGSGDSYTHDGEEFLYVLKGELQISLLEQEYRLRQGDSFYFESATPHQWKNPGRKETWVLWVNTPPTF